MINITVSKSILSEMIKKAVTKVLSEDYSIYDDYSEAGDNGDSSELSQFMSSVENDLNMQSKFNDGDYNDKLISTDELINIAEKAGAIVIDAKDALMDLGVIYDQNDIPMYRVEEILAEYDIPMEDLNGEGEIHEQGSNLGQLSQEDVDKFFYNFLDPKLHAGFNSNESGLGEPNEKQRRDEVLYAMKELGISNIGDLWKEFQSIEAKTGGATGYQESKKTSRNKPNINEYSNDRVYLETYIDGQQLMGSDGTIAIHNTNNRALNNTINTRINTIKGLIPNVKPYIGKARNITLKLVNGNNKVLKEFDITKQVLSELGQFTEAKTPKVIRVKFKELKNVITQMIKEEAAMEFFDNKDGDTENNFEQPFNENDPQINEGEVWASDGGYYSKPERDIVISKKDAEFINSIIEKFKKDIVSPDGIILVNNTSVGQINLKIIRDLIKNVGVNFEHDGEGEHDYYWLAPDQDIQNIMAELELADQLFYDRIEDEKVIPAANEEKEIVKKYSALVTHDNGKVRITTSASSEEAAIAKIMKAEGCPASAISKVSLKESNGESKAVIYLNSINNGLATDLQGFDGYSNNGGIKFKLNNEVVVLSVDRTGKNINIGFGGGVMYGEEPGVTSLIRKIDTIWGV